MTFPKIGLKLLR